MERRMRGAMVFFFAVVPVVGLQSAVPLEFNYQGMLREFGAPVTGVRTMTFRLYDVDAGGTPLWTSGPQVVAVTSGSFNVALNLAGVDLRRGDLWIETEVAGQTFSPRQKLLSQVYAMHARTAEGLSVSSGGAVVTVGGTVCLDIRAASTTVYGDLRVTGQIGGTLNLASIPDGSIESRKIASLAAEKVTGQIVGSQIAAGTVSTAQIADGAVTDPKIVLVSAGKISGQIVGAQIADGAVSTDHIAAGAVTDPKIVSVSAGKIYGQIVSTQIAAGAVTGAHIAPEAVTSDHIALGAIHGTRITDGSIYGWKLADLAVTPAKIHSVDAAQVNSGTFQNGSYTFPGSVNQNGSVMLNAADGTLFQLRKVTSMLLPAAAMSFGQTYTASTDGFIYAYVNATAQGSHVLVEAWVGNGTNVVAAAFAAGGTGGVGVMADSFCVPVARGQSFRCNITSSGGSFTAKFFWQPIGREQ